tara:strand:- start:234 stop:647 length:414 start_codon:yes stop_codon:yes gene_type:complete
MDLNEDVFSVILSFLDNLYSRLIIRGVCKSWKICLPENKCKICDKPVYLPILDKGNLKCFTCIKIHVINYDKWITSKYRETLPDIYYTSIKAWQHTDLLVNNIHHCKFCGIKCYGSAFLCYHMFVKCPKSKMHFVVK